MGLKVRGVSALVEMITAPNPGPKTLEGTNTYLVGQDRIVLIDPGPDIPDQLDALAEHIASRGSLEAILLTHGHLDHAPGAARLAARFDVRVLMSDSVEPDVWNVMPNAVGLPPDWSMGIDDWRLNAIPTPGHSFDHVCFMLSPERILFSGDTILGEGTTLIALPEGDMAQFMHTLELLRSLDPHIIAPGHGPIVRDPDAKLDEYVAHRRQREMELLQAMARGAMTVDGLVGEVYGPLDPEVFRLASLSVGAQLAKLEVEGRVVQVGEAYRLTASS